jgi:hypothetical protein
MNFKIGDTVRCVHRPAGRPEDSMEFKIAEFQQGDGNSTQLDIVYACGPSLHSSARIKWPVDEIELVEGEKR